MSYTFLQTYTAAVVPMQAPTAAPTAKPTRGLAQSAPAAKPAAKDIKGAKTEISVLSLNDKLSA